MHRLEGTLPPEILNTHVPKNIDMFAFTPFIETAAGIAYIDRVRAVLAASAAPLCTREIHAALGIDAMPRHTLDALSKLCVEEVPSGCMTRYRLAPPPAPELKPAFNSQDRTLEQQLAERAAKKKLADAIRRKARRFRNAQTACTK